MPSRAEQLLDLGQSIWLDFIRRGPLQSGEFAALVRDHGVVGVTSNPTIFQQAIAQSDDYDKALEPLVAKGLGTPQIFESLAIEDIRLACDALAAVAQRSKGMDGRVSLEVSPKLAHDTAGTIADARRLHREVARPNVMIKVPATKAGLPAITVLLAEGICVNVTLIFSLARYEEVMEAYLAALEQRAAQGLPLDGIHSVASFFISRVDSKVDKAIDARAAAQPSGSPMRAALEAMRGKAAVANARLAYERFEQVFGGERFAPLRARGAHAQRPLWASTSTKNPAYPDTMYVDELIGPHTVNTVPPATLTAFNDHGKVAVTLRDDLAAAHRLFQRLDDAGIPSDRLIAELEPEGVEAFAKSYDALLEAIDKRRVQMTK